MDFKFFSHWLRAKKQSILLQHMHEKDLFILTNKCETKRLHENETKRHCPFGGPHPRFRVKAYSRIYLSKKYFFYHACVKEGCSASLRIACEKKT
jgi:hypothetical protein